MRLLNRAARLEETLRVQAGHDRGNELGQLLKMVRAEYLIDAFGLKQDPGPPLKVSEIVNRNHTEPWEG